MVPFVHRSVFAHGARLGNSFGPGCCTLKSCNDLLQRFEIVHAVKGLHSQRFEDSRESA